MIRTDRLLAFVALAGIPAGLGWLATWAMDGQYIDALAVAQAAVTGLLMAFTAAPLAITLLPRVFRTHQAPAQRSAQFGTATRVSVPVRSRAPANTRW
jgi:hypothetical protein